MPRFTVSRSDEQAKMALLYRVVRPIADVGADQLVYISRLSTKTIKEINNPLTSLFVMFIFCDYYYYAGISHGKRASLSYLFYHRLRNTDKYGIK